MKIFIQLTGDNDEVIAEHEADALQPTQWRTPSGKRITSGHYEYYGFTVQPHVRSTHPSGYQGPTQTPPLRPQNGQISVTPPFAPAQIPRTNGGDYPQVSPQGSGLASSSPIPSKG